MIGLDLLVRCEPSHRVELLQTLETLCQEQVNNGGCVECRVFEDITLPNGFLWQEWWRSRQNLEDHLRSVVFRTLLGAIKVLGTLESARTVELQDSTSVTGAFLSDRTDIEERLPEG